MKYYAGIGSRETPKEILSIMNIIGLELGHFGYTLRSGHAPGADIAFEIGCNMVEGKKEIYLPWEGFNGSESRLYPPSPSAHDVAELFHPAWHRCSGSAKALLARNSHQIFGLDMMTPVDFVICWTKDGGPSGGTGQALRIAKHFNIRIINLFNETFILPLETLS